MHRLDGFFDGRLVDEAPLAAAGVIDEDVGDADVALDALGGRGDRCAFALPTSRAKTSALPPANGYFGGDPIQLGFVARHQHDARPARGELLRRELADAARCAGDEDKSGGNTFMWSPSESSTKRQSSNPKQTPNG